MKGNVIRFPIRKELSPEESKARIEEIISQQLEAANNEGYVSPEERLKRDYKLEEFLGMPFGTLYNSKIGGNK